MVQQMTKKKPKEEIANTSLVSANVCGVLTPPCQREVPEPDLQVVTVPTIMFAMKNGTKIPYRWKLLETLERTSWSSRAISTLQRSVHDDFDPWPRLAQARVVGSLPQDSV